MTMPNEKEPKMLANRIRTPDGTILQSFNRHDYKTHLDKNGEIYMVDGGLDYIRRTVTKVPAEELSVWEDDPHELIREAMHWGTRGKDGKQPLKYVPVSSLGTEHIEAILETQSHITDAIRKVFIDELKYRENL
jgi:hypothetical protein